MRVAERRACGGTPYARQEAWVTAVADRRTNATAKTPTSPTPIIDWSRYPPEMSEIHLGWLALPLLVVLVLAVHVLIVIVARRRQRRAAPQADSRQETMANARKAIRQSARQSRRRRSGSLRGKGGGGSEGQAIDSGVSSESGGTP